MYNIINQNIDRIVHSVDEGLDVSIYLSLMSRFRNVNVVQDTEFQAKYCKYWRLYGAGLSQDFRASYFELMEVLRGRPTPTIVEVIRPLYEVPTDNSGRKTLQFSFASKLLHTLDPHKPIYDSMVANFFFLPTPVPNENLEVRLQSLLTSYSFLCTEYERILHLGLLQPSITRFRQEFQVPAAYTDEKVIDTLIWRFVNLLKSGAIRNGLIVYS
jgi:hypothetical protein